MLPIYLSEEVSWCPLENPNAKPVLEELLSVSKNSVLSWHQEHY
jgi:hypothetical protein